MATLYVENVPEELYEALRERARANGNPISAEVIRLLRQNVPTAVELARRREFVRRAARVRASARGAPGPSSEELLRQDRER